MIVFSVRIIFFLAAFVFMIISKILGKIDNYGDRGNFNDETFSTIALNIYFRANPISTKQS